MNVSPKLDCVGWYVIDMPVGEVATVRMIADACDCSKPTARNALNKMVENGYLEIIQKQWRKNKPINYYRKI